MLRRSPVVTLSLALLLCCSPSTVQARHHYSNSYSNNDAQTAIAAALTVGGAVAAGVGIYALCDWLFSRTDEQVLSDARCMTGDADTRYIRVRDLFIAYLGTESRYSPSEYTMPLLEDIARQECTNYSIDTYIHNLDSFVKSMRSEYTEVEKRIRSIERNSRKKYQKEYLYQDLQAARTQLHARLVNLERIQAFLEYHRSYFNLASHYNEMYTTYAPVLANLAYVLQCPPAVHALVPFIMATNQVQNQRFVYLKYFEMLNRDTESFNKSINSVHALYQPLMSAAQGMARDLELLKGVIRSSDRYVQETHQWHVEEMNRKQLEMQQALLRAEQAKAQAAQAQAIALQERNEIEAKKLALQRQELAQKRDTTVVVIG